MQIVGGPIGAWAAHLMYDPDLIQISQEARSGPAQWFAEGVATFGPVFTILATLKARESAVAMAGGLSITAAHWFTASTSFANPAVTIARALSDSFAGIRRRDVVSLRFRPACGGNCCSCFLQLAFAVLAK